MARRRRLLSLVAGACLVTVAGCGAGTTPSAEPTGTPSPTASPLPSIAPTPSTAPTNDSSGSALFTLPDDWTEIELTEAGLRNWIAVVGDSNPELASFMEEQVDSGIIERLTFMAFGYEGGHNIGNMTVEQGPAGGVTLDGAEPFLVAQLTQVPNVSDVSSRRVTLPIGDALLITGTMTTVLASGSEFVQAQSTYVVIEDDVVYLVTFTCSEANEICLADAETIIDTFRP
jgi:hypothetical protein